MKNLRRYRLNQGFLRKYHDGLYKLTLCKAVRVQKYSWEELLKRRKGVNEEKLSNNIMRAKTKVFELAICNEWDFFITFTIDKKKCDRYNLDAYHKKLAHWIRNYNSENGTEIKYVFVPEKHQDGAWHEHGFIKGVPKERMRLFTLEEKLPKYIRDKLLMGEEVYEWLDYRREFGYNDCEQIRNREAASRYVTKYISKDLEKSVKEVGAHLYYCSQKLQRAELIKKGSMIPNSFKPSFENEYAAVKWIRGNGSDPEQLQNIKALLL